MGNLRPKHGNGSCKGTTGSIVISRRILELGV